jgi:predicted secreted protein
MKPKTIVNTATAAADKSKEEKNELVLSYLTLRNLIGFGGMLLPIVLAVFPSRSSDYIGFEPSISDYYYTDRGDILVVMLCVIGAFLISYYGYTFKEWMLTFIAGIAGIGVAFVPTKIGCNDCLLSVHTKYGGVFKTLAGTGWHFTFAAIFLLSLAIMSLVFFTKGEGTSINNPAQKAKRNHVFRICGWTIIASLLILGVYFIVKHYTDFDVKPFPFVYFFEAIAVEAFGFSWLVKGQTLWPDGEHYMKKGLRSLKVALKK